MINILFKIYSYELKKNMVLIPFLFLANFGLGGYFFIIGTRSLYSINTILNEETIRYIFVTNLFVLPLILYYSLTIKSRNTIDYNLLSEPVSKFTILLCKYMALLSLVVILPFGNYVIGKIWFSMAKTNVIPPRQEELIRNFAMTSPVLMLAGMLSAADAISNILRKLKGLFVFVFLTFSTLFSCLLYLFFKFILIHFFEIKLYINKMMHIRLIVNNLLLFILGIMFFSIGLFVYNKYKSSEDNKF